MPDLILNLHVDDMTTDHCAESVLRGIYSVAGVISAEVSLEDKRATVHYDDSQSSAEDFTQAIAAQGYNATVI